MLDALEAIVLAGGSGSRFGGGKLTHAWRGGALIDGALAAAFAAPARSVTVVTGADAKVATAARAYAARSGQLKRLRIIHCADHAEGMGATLRAGIASLPTDADAAFVFLGDMPTVPPAIPPALAAALDAGAPAAAPRFDGRRGHPVLFSAALFPQLRALTGDQGARDVLRALGPRLALVETDDPGVLVDIDSPDDLDGVAGR
ncbi:MAG TPA: NTP transferase domain-containing protein [Caulobacteraceae bacterium]|nr:NTP transferase domain-containing protein [Caulobacteraceae bacterium]